MLSIPGGRCTAEDFLPETDEHRSRAIFTQARRVGLRAPGRIRTAVARALAERTPAKKSFLFWLKWVLIPCASASVVVWTAVKRTDLFDYEPRVAETPIPTLSSLDKKEASPFPSPSARKGDSPTKNPAEPLTSSSPPAKLPDDGQGDTRKGVSTIPPWIGNPGPGTDETQKQHPRLGAETSEDRKSDGLPDLMPPIHLRARGLGTSVELSWDQPEGGSPRDGDQYVIEVSMGTTSSFRALRTLPATTLQAVVLSARPTEPVSFRMKAVRDDAESKYSEVVTLAATTLLPPTELQLGSGTGKAIVLSWQIADSDATSYEIEASFSPARPGAVDSPFASLATVGKEVRSYPVLDLSQLPAPGKYTYRIRSVAGTLVSSYSESASYELKETAPSPGPSPLAPTPPLSIRIRMLSPHSYFIWWSPPDVPATTIVIERYNRFHNTFKELGRVSGTERSFTTPAPVDPISEVYRLRAESESGKVASSPPIGFCAGDVNGDWKVSSEDDHLVRDAYGQLGSIEPELLPAEDINGDGKIDNTGDTRIIHRQMSGGIFRCPPLPP